MHLRLASYNLHKCVGMDRKRLPARNIDVINALSADLVALQEVDRRPAPRHFVLPPDMIAAETDFVHLGIASNPESLGWHGQSVLLRKGLAVREVRRIDLPSLEPRGAIMVEIAADPAAGVARNDFPGRFRLVAVHLALMRRWRRLQLEAVRRALADAPEVPTAIIGDFNEWSASGGMEPLAQGFRVHAPGRSYPATQPVGRLDRVALSEGLHLIEAGVLNTPLSRVASDHLPVWADVRADHWPLPALPGPPERRRHAAGGLHAEA